MALIPLLGSSRLARITLPGPRQAFWGTVHWARRAVSPGWPPLLFFLCALYLFRQAILERRIFYQGDTILFYFPVARLFDHALAQGTIPFWTPYIFAGHPLFADGEAGMLYPPNLIAHLLLPVSEATIALLVLRFFLTALFAYLYGRSLKLDRPAATVVALAFAYGSFIVGQIHHTNLGTTALWLPLVLAGIEWALRADSRVRWAHLTLSGVALGSAALTVHINPFLMMLMLVGLYTPFRILVCRDVALPDLRARLWKTVSVLTVPVVLGLLLGAVQLLPLWELSTFSRGQGVDYDFATGFATPPANVITLLFPYFFRDADGGYWSPFFRWNTTVYVGIAPLVLAAIAIVRVRVRLTLFFVAVAVVGLLLAFGDYLPTKVYALVWHLPGFSSLRGPARFMYWTAFALAVLSGFGMQSLLSLRAEGWSRGWKRWIQRGKAGPSLLRTLLCLTLFTLALIGVLFAAHQLVRLAPQETAELLKNHYLSLRGAGLERTLAKDPVEALRYSLDPTSTWTLRSLLWLSLTMALLWAWYRFRACAWLWRGALIGLVVVDLLAFADHFHPSLSIDSLKPSGPAVSFLQERAGLDRVLTLWPIMETWPDRLLPAHIAEASGYSSLQPWRHDDFLNQAGQGLPNFLDLMNVRYVVAASNWIPSWLQRQQPAYSDQGVVIYERPRRLGRVFIAHKVQVGSPGEILASLADPAYDPRSQVWIEEPLPPEMIPAADSSAQTRVEIQDYSAEVVTVQVYAPKRALLVLTDSFYPGWTAYVDGNPQRIYRANYIFRAVPLPSGRHVVRFAFEPLSVRLGALISLAAIMWTMGVFGLAGYTRYCRKR